MGIIIMKNCGIEYLLLIGKKKSIMCSSLAAALGHIFYNLQTMHMHGTCMHARLKLIERAFWLGLDKFFYLLCYSGILNFFYLLFFSKGLLFFLSYLLFPILIELNNL